MDENKLLIFIVCVVVFIVAAYIVRAIFSIPTILRQQKAQTILLSKIAEKQGVNKKEIDAVLIFAELKEEEEDIPNSAKEF